LELITLKIEHQKYTKILEPPIFLNSNSV